MESSGSLVGVFCQNIGKWESSEMCVESDSVGFRDSASIKLTIFYIFSKG